MEKILQRIALELYSGNYEMIAQSVQEALDEGVKPQEILDVGLIAGMDKVGKEFKSGELYLPEVLVAARAMQVGTDKLHPLLAAHKIKTMKKIVVGTVKGDMHDIGKNIVKMMLEGAGFELVDLGVDVSPDVYVAAVKQHNPVIIGLSALLTTTMLQMKETVHALEASGMRHTVKVLVGGAPVTEDYAKQIGADAYAPDAITAVDIALNLSA
jgi:5-methyltetrahydrofolate--homocysteine methyltransferase